MYKGPSTSQCGPMNVDSQPKLAVLNEQEAKQACEESLAAVNAAIDSVVGSTENTTEFQENTTRYPLRSFFGRMCGSSSEDRKETSLRKSSVDESPRTYEDSEVTSESRQDPLVQSESKYGHQKSGVDNSTLVTEDDLLEDDIESVPQTASSKPFLDTIPVTLNKESRDSEESQDLGKDSKCWECCQKCVYGIENFCGNNKCLEKFSNEFHFLVAFLFSFFVCFMIGINIEQKDGPYSAMVCIVWCIVVILAFDRGCFTMWLERKVMENDFPAGEDGNLVTTLSGSLCMYNDIDEPVVQRHSRYTRSPEDTTFSCEVADVSEMDSSEYPEMKTMVQEEDYDSSSSSGNFSGRPRMVTADVHSINTAENYISTCDCQGACACPNQK